MICTTFVDPLGPPAKLPSNGRCQQRRQFRLGRSPRSDRQCAHIGYRCRPGPDAETRAAVVAAGLGILAKMLRHMQKRRADSGVAIPISSTSSCRYWLAIVVVGNAIVHL